MKRPHAPLIWFSVVYGLGFVVLMVINLLQARHGGGHAYF